MRLSELHEQYGDRVRFLQVYIREAHPVDGWWLAEVPVMKWATRLYSPDVALDLYDPTTLEQRLEVATQCETALGHGMETWVDSMDDAMAHAYAAWPVRLYLIGVDGRVVYPGDLGPWGFHPEELKGALDDYLPTLEP